MVFDRGIIFYCHNKCELQENHKPGLCVLFLFDYSATTCNIFRFQEAGRAELAGAGIL